MVRVLLVDDVPEVRLVLRTALRLRKMFEVVGEAANGNEAIKLAEREQPDIVVLDLGLPDLAGRDVFSRIREVSPAAKVVIFSAADESLNSDLAARAAGYAVKGGADLAYVVELLEELGRPANQEAVRHLRADLTSAREARSFTRTVLADWHVDRVVEDALLVVTELVTNAVTHAQSECDLRLALTSDVVRIEVTDAGRGTPDPLPPSPTRNHGRGLHLIDAVAAAWGVEPSEPSGKRVWAEIRRPA